MPRGRVVRPEFWDDEKLSTISRDARLTFIGMWNQSDDYAVVKGNHIWLKNKIYPYDDINKSTFEKWMDELKEINAIISFNVNSEAYYFIRTFLKHQTISKPSKTRNPEPPEHITKKDTPIPLPEDSYTPPIPLPEGSHTPPIPLPTEGEVEGEVKGEGEREPENPKPSTPEYEKIIAYLNKKAAAGFDHKKRPTRDHIRARWKEGYRFEDFKKVIDVKSLQWLNDGSMNSYLRPNTLFAGKFEGYLQEAARGTPTSDPTKQPAKTITQLMPEAYQILLSGSDLDFLRFCKTNKFTKDDIAAVRGKYEVEQTGAAPGVNALLANIGG